MNKPESLCDSFVTLPAIGSNGIDKWSDLIIRDSQTLQYRADRLSRSVVGNERMGKSRLFFAIFILPYGYSDNQFCLVFCATTTCAGSTWPIEGFIYLDKTGKLIVGASICHCFPDLMSHNPYGFIVLDFQLSLHLSYGYASLRGCHAKDQPKPFQQGGLCLVKYCS